MHTSRDLLRTNQKRMSLILLVLLVACAVLLRPSLSVLAGDVSDEPGTVTTTATARSQSAPYVAGEVLVKFKLGVTSQRIRSTLTALNAVQIGAVSQIALKRLKVPVGKEQEISDELQRNSAVEYAEPNYRIYVDSIPNDSYYSSYQWNMPQVRANSAWDITTGSNAVRVAVVDTGIDWFHPDLQANVVPGNNCGDTSTNAVDLNGHGTHVAGIIAGIGNNSEGVAGMTWNVKIVPVKVIGCSGSGGNIFEGAAGITWASDPTGGNAKILNVSWGNPTISLALIDAVGYAQQQGALVIAAAGNCGGSNWASVTGCYSQNQEQYPATLSNVMAVAATGYNDVHSPYSNHGMYVSVSAPGGTGGSDYSSPNDWIISTYARTVSCDIGLGHKCPSNGYAELAGTSQATPHVTGLAALVWSVNPTLSADQVQSIIETSADDRVGDPGLDTQSWDEYYGWGRINAYLALYNTPLVIPNLVSPGNGTSVGSLTPLFQWTASPYVDGYVVHISRSPSFSYIDFLGTPSSNGYIPPSNLNPGTTYYWRVYARQGYRDSNASETWTFTTPPASSNTPPNTPSNPLPPNGNTNVATSAVLNWSGGDPNAGDTVTYDVYMGPTSGNLTLVSSSQGGISYNPGGLQPGYTYYWRIVAKDNHSALTTGPTWYFTVAVSSPGDQTPPTASWISPSNGQTISAGTINLQASASDDSSGVNRVAFSAQWSGAWHGLGTDYSSPFSYNWDLCGSGVPNGDIELGLEAWDNNGNHYVYSAHYSNYHITKSYNCGTPPPTPGTWERDTNCGTYGVTLYEHPNYAGACLHAVPSAYSHRFQDYNFNDIASSVRMIGGAWALYLWVDDDRGGQMKQITGDVSDLTSWTFDNVASSADIEALGLCKHQDISVNPAGAGAITRVTGPNCGDGYFAGTSIQFVATAYTGYAFSYWSGNASGTSATTTAQIWNDPSLATANFAAVTPCYSLTTSSSPAGGGYTTITPTPNCGSQYTSGTSVTIVANPYSGYSFSNWSGSANSSANPIAVLMNGNKTVTANFAANPTCYALTLDVDPIGSGTVVATPGPNCNAGTQYLPGTNVSLSAIANSGYLFSTWSGDFVAPNNPVTVPMVGPRHITAEFTPGRPDLQPYASTGYQFPVVPSTRQGTQTTNILYAGAATFFDGHFTNSGLGTVNGTFYVELWVDDRQLARYPYTGLGIGGTDGFDDWADSVSQPGWHTVRLVVDPGNLISESEESNNTWEQQFYWAPIAGWKAEYFANMALTGNPWLTRDDFALNFDWFSDPPDPALPADGFSARWTRAVNFPAGSYRFYMRHDDGARLYIDDVPKINAWATCCSWDVVDVPLSTGNHTIRMEMFDNGGWANASLWWERLDITGWRGAYYNNETLTDPPTLVRDDGGNLGFNFEWADQSPDPLILPDHFSASFTRVVTFSAGAYRFDVTHDDGARLYIDGSLALGNWCDNCRLTDSVTPTLSAGAHNLRLDVRENIGWAAAGITWTAVTNPLANIAVTPNPITLTVGVTQTFAAFGTDALGNSVPITPLWSTDAGWMTDNILSVQWTPTSNKRVTATVGSVSGSAIVNVVVGPLANVIVAPDPITITVGSTRIFSVLGVDAYGNPLPITPLWSTDAGTMTNNVLTAQTTPAVNRHVTATVGVMSGSAVVNIVAGAVNNNIAVGPNPITLTVNATQTFAATGADAFGNAITISPLWSTDAGVMTGNVLTAQSFPANGRHVTATVSGISGSALVNVMPASDTVVINAVNPPPPYCVVRNSSDLSERLLELTGQNFSTTLHNLQFRRVITGDVSLQFHMEVNWESSTRITVDMNRITHLLWPTEHKVRLNARLTDGSYQPVSDWSTEFILADDVATCGIARPRPPTAVTISGPTMGVIQTNYTFTATASPITATQPITHLWQATGQSLVTHVSGLTDTIIFNWSSPGPQIITATAINADGTVTNTYIVTISVPPTSVGITGPLDGLAGVNSTFTATVSPLTTTQPVTYVWQATGQSSVIHVGTSSDTVRFTWAITGSQAVTVSAANAGGTVTATHWITLSIAPSQVVIVGPAIGLAGTNYTFTATTNPPTVTQPITYVWQAMGQSSTVHVGGLNDTATFSWTTPGLRSIVVTGTNVGGSASATTTLWVTAGPLASISVMPSPVTVTVGATQTFTASGADAFGNPVSITPVWTSDAGVMAGNLLTALTTPLSNKHVTATVGSLSGVALVNVASGALAHIDVTPGPVTVTVNTTQPFTATGTDAFGNVIAISPIWTTNAGVMTGSVLTAQALPANGRHVTATVSGISGSAIVNVSPTADTVAILSVNPAPPYCVLRNSPDLYDRLLELTGQNFSTTDHNLEFRRVITGDTSLQFHMEINWETTIRITVDMNRIKGLLWPDSKVTLNARLTNGSYQPVSDWSPDFILADDVATCGLARPRPLSNVTIDGPVVGSVQTSYLFTATAAPPTATLPITYVWQATGQSVVTSTGGLSNSTAFIWNSPGSQLITVTAMNTTNAVADVHIITITHPLPAASFTASPTSGVKPLMVVFTDTSTGTISSRVWTFGDGGTSVAQNSAHQYTSAGLFTVTLQVNGPGGSSFLTRTNLITVTEPPPVANFTASPTDGLKPLTVVFTDASTGTISAWAWNFGDGSNAVSQNPTHQYTTAGVYTASLRVTGPGGSSVLTRTNLITVTEPPSVANFTASPTSGASPLTVAFTDTSAGLVTSWIWSFGDNSTSIFQNPSHQYTSAGSFTVTLQVSGPGGPSTLARINYITVHAPVHAGFVASPVSGVAPLTVTFTQTSTGDYASSLWNFGDGATSVLPNPAHTYLLPGNYSVTLTSEGLGGLDTITRSNYITVSAPVQANFSASTQSGGVPLKVTFTNTSSGDYASSYWNFGDEMTSTEQSPTHIYIAVGTYTVTLTIDGAGGSHSISKSSYISAGCNIYLPLMLRNR